MQAIYCTVPYNYLLQFLLQHLCIWTIQNIVSSGKKAMQILHSQGVTATLTRLLEETENSELLTEVLLALSLILDYDDQFIR